MSLVQRCRTQISASDWSKGNSYFRSDSVGNVKVKGSVLTATVVGSSRYKVTIDWAEVESSHKLRVNCTCPRFADVGMCKHVAATLLEIDLRKLDMEVPGDFPLKLVEFANGMQRDPDDSEARDEYDDDFDGGDDDFDGDDDDFDDDDFDDVEYGQSKLMDSVNRLREAHRSARQQGNTTAATPSFVERLTKIERAFRDFSGRGPSPSPPTPKPRQLYYALDITASTLGQVIIEFWQRVRTKNGELGQPKHCGMEAAVVSGVEDRAEQELLRLLIHCGQPYFGSYGSYSSSITRPHRISLPSDLLELILPQLCATGRFGPRLADAQGDNIVQPLDWDPGPAWSFRVAVNGDEDNGWKFVGELFREHEVIPLTQTKAIMKNGLLLVDQRLTRWHVNECWPWVNHLNAEGPIELTQSELDAAIERFYSLPGLPPLALPESWEWQHSSVPPQPCVRLTRPPSAPAHADFFAKVFFRYGDLEVLASDQRAAVVNRPTKQIVTRDTHAELRLIDQLRSRGFRKSPYTYEPHNFILAPNKFMPVVEQLVADNWRVEAEGQAIRTPGEFSISVTSGVDWFDLSADCDFGGIRATLPELLEAVRKGETFILLGDGSRGVLPQEWLKRYSSLADLGQPKDAALRFSAPQAAILDALLAAQPKVEYDVAFTRIRRKLQQFDGIAPVTEPATFKGTLREYQREGLGWLHFLREFGYGGCLADDMGLGKTVQVLALLESRRKQKAKNGEAKRPSLVVVPKSLVFNWMDEARRFTPKLRTCDYTGLQRAVVLDQLDQYDLIVTTYGTMRRDIVKLREIPFDYIILDEAQAIKNANSQSAKSCRLLQARHRLAMTGTPVENHLGELWSLFEFLNPGMLGRSGKLTSLAGNSRNGDAESLGLLRKALRPYMLRRTKEQVLRELPAKTEQTLHCELEGEERRRYDELRQHYRDTLLKRIDQVGLKKAKMHVLEALLRLRQAACHPALIDKKRTRDSSAKLDLLLEQLQEVRAEGHKALVFSQFTSFLDVVRTALDRDKIVYEYLDGRTRDRQARVERFQTDATCSLFLISLKAGGHGLNLTAADYVFILDPWWNPAVEMQAIDRAHRIGQTKPVFAYRLIARDTVEEKILELQERKRELAEAIIAADDRLVANLTAEDLRLLLS